MNRRAALTLAVLVAIVEMAGSTSKARAESAAKSLSADAPVEMFDAMQSGAIEATFIAKNSHRGRIVMHNKTDKPLTVELPDAFIGMPLAQMGGMGGGMMGGMGGGMGGGQQSVGGGGGGRGGRGGGGGGRGGRGGFNIPPEKIVRVDVPLLCLDHGLKEPSASKKYVIRPIENYVQDPALIQIVTSYANGELPPGAAQAAVWNVNSGVGWDELSSKLTGTVRSIVREPFFSGEEIRGAMAIVSQARQMTADKKVEPRPFTLPGEKQNKQETDPSKVVSPGEEVNAPAEKAEKSGEPSGTEGAPAEGDATEVAAKA